MAAAAPEIRPNSPATADSEVLQEAGSDPSLLLLSVVNNDVAPIELLAEVRNGLNENIIFDTCSFTLVHSLCDG